MKKKICWFNFEGMDGPTFVFNTKNTNKNKDLRLDDNNFIDLPDVIQDKVNGQRLQSAALQTLVTNDTLGLWVQIKVAPKTLSKYSLLHAQFLSIQRRKLIHSESPAVNGGRKDDVASGWIEIDMRVVLGLDMPI